MVVLLAEMAAGAPLTMLVSLLLLLVERLHGVGATLVELAGRWRTSCATSMEDELRGIAITKISQMGEGHGQRQLTKSRTRYNF
jgi:hypothetical protein